MILLHLCWIKVATAQLKPGDAIILSLTDDQQPSFGVIKMILIDDHDTLLCVNTCVNIGYRSHLRAWEVQYSSQVSVVKFETEMMQQVLQPIPANFNTYYISLKHAL